MLLCSNDPETSLNQFFKSDYQTTGAKSLLTVLNIYTLFPHDEKAKANRNQTTCFYDKETAAKAITYLPKCLSFYLCNSRYICT